MKCFFLLFCGWFLGWSSCFGQVDYTADSPYRVHLEGGKVWTLGAAKLYTGPSRQAGVRATLRAGTPLQLLERLDETETRQGFRTNWYRVQYQQEEGFIWGGDLAIAQLELPQQAGTLHYGLTSIKAIQRGGYEEPQLEIALVTSQNGVLLDSLNIVAIGTLYTNTKAQLKGAQGLAGAQQILELAFSDGYCGGVAATITLVWDGQYWQELGLLSQGFGDNHFSNAYYHYPNDHKRGSQLVELHREEGYYNQQQQPVYTLQSTQVYEWTGTQLLQIEAAAKE